MKKKTLLLYAGIAATGAAIAAFVKYLRKERSDAWFTQIGRHHPLTALITGASSGIGEAYARKLASIGHNVVLVARRETRLQSLASEFRQQYGVTAEALAADLSTEAGIARVEKRIVEGGDIDFLVNNAGYAVFGNFAEVPIERMLEMINCHTLAAVRFCRAALPGMITRNRGAIVNVSSIGAFAPRPKDSTYVAVKAYLAIFSESLAIELRDTSIRIQALCPGFTHTEFHDSPQYTHSNVKERIPSWLWMNTGEVIAASLRALGENVVVCIPGIQNQIIVAGGRVGLSTLLLAALRRFFPKAAQGL